MIETAANSALEYLSSWLAVMFAYGIIKAILFTRIEDNGLYHTAIQKAISYLLGIGIAVGFSLIVWFFSKSIHSALIVLFIMAPTSFFVVYNLYEFDKIKNK